MKSNKLFCVLIGILIGFLAKAENKTIILPQAEDALIVVNIQSGHVYQVKEHPTFECKTPDHKTRKIRHRFRGVSLFEVPSNNSSQSSCALYYTIPAKVTTQNGAPVLPFYYVFLFRLTPF